MWVLELLLHCWWLGARWLMSLVLGLLVGGGGDDGLGCVLMIGLPDKLFDCLSGESWWWDVVLVLSGAGTGLLRGLSWLASLLRRCLVGFFVGLTGAGIGGVGT